MTYKTLIFFATLLLCTLGLAPAGASAQPGWKKIFDGKTLSGWQAPDMSYFSVEDGAITGTTTKEHNPPYNQFIVWQGGEVADFELKFKFRIFGAKSNSGMQFRSVVKDKGLVHGYQADMDGAGKYLGGIWDEYGPRRSLAGRGEKAVIDESGKRTVTRFAESESLLKNIKMEDWNDYHITAIGSRITLRINGQVTAELDDRETGKAARSGVLAMPIIPGEPMKVQYKDIYLKQMGENDERQQTQRLFENVSSGFGQHDAAVCFSRFGQSDRSQRPHSRRGHRNRRAHARLAEQFQKTIRCRDCRAV